MKHTILALFVALFLYSGTASAQTCPGFPARGIQIIDALYNPQLAFGDDDQRRSLTRTFIEQIVFEFPSEGWSWKSADPGRPPSKDSISRTVNGRLCNWDWQNGQSRTRSIQAGQPGDDITGQNAIPVPGVNHLSSPVPGPGPSPTPVPAPAPVVDLSGVYLQLQDVRQRLDNVYQQNERIFAAQEAERAADVAAAQTHQALLVTHVAETRSFFAKIGGFFSDGKTIAAVVGGLATFVATTQAK